jgi:hypothetical protein
VSGLFARAVIRVAGTLLMADADWSASCHRQTVRLRNSRFRSWARRALNTGNQTLVIAAARELPPGSSSRLAQQASKHLAEDDSFTVAETDTGEQKSQASTGPRSGGGGAWEYNVYDPGDTTNRTWLDLTDGGFDPANVRKHQEPGLVQHMKNVPVHGGTWESPASIDFEPYSVTVLWITPYTDPSATPITPEQLSHSVVGGNVVLNWQYAPIESGSDQSSPPYSSFFYFEVLRDQTTISPKPRADHRP